MSDKIRVLYDCQAFDGQQFGGVSKVFAEIYKQHVKNGIVDPIISVSRTANVNYNSLGICNNTGLTNSQYTFKLLNEGRFDIFVPTYYGTYFLNRLNGKKFVMFVPDMISELYFDHDDGQNVGKRAMIPLAERIFVPTNNTKNDILKFFNIDPDKIVVWGHGLTDGFGESNQTFPKIPFRYILYVGQRWGYKRFDWFIKHIEPFIRQNNDINILCTGPGFSQTEADMLRSHGMSGRIAHIFAKNEDHMAQIYKDSEMFIYPSEYEGFGIPILEAYKMNCPVVLNDNSCFREVAGDAAQYFQLSDNSSNLVETINHVMNMTDVQKQDLIKRQNERLELYSWQKSVNIIETELEKIIRR